MSSRDDADLSGAPLDDSPTPIRPGPRYDLGGVLGRGGMGVVEVAHDTVLGRDVARKTVLPGESFAARLEREARLAARLEHPGIVPVYDGGKDSEGRPFYTMRLLRGQSLADALRAGGGPARRSSLVRHVLDAAAAIAYAHRRGIIHRDLKPSNIMVGDLGETVVTDWGLACTLDEAARPGPRVGTPAYCSPEQAAGEALDVRTDVYGLGAMLDEVLSAYEEEDTPEALRAVAARARAPRREDRYPNADTFAADLLAWFEGRQVLAHSYSTFELVGLLARRWRAPLAVGLIATLLLGVVITIGVF